MMKLLPVFLGVLPLLSLAGCGGGEPAASAGAGVVATEPHKAAPAEQAPAPAPAPKKPLLPPKFDLAQLTAFFGSEPTAPKVDNPPTPEKVALGRALYHATALSKNGNLSCASCHDLAKYGQDGKPTSPGSDGKQGARNSPTTLNAFRQIAQFWDLRAATVEDQAIMPVLNPIEHGVVDEAELVAKIKTKPELVAAFGKAFPGAGDAVTAANFKLAVGAFERTLVTRSPFDEFLDGKNSALTTEQKWGVKTFIDVGCTTCHLTRLVGGNMFQKLGVQRPYASKDEGRFEVTKNEVDKFVFKVPSLLNVEHTAPYLHDGSVATLAETVKIMGQIQLNKDLKDEEIQSIVAFLKALSGPLPDGAAMK